MEQKKVKEITSRNEDFAKWYTDIVTKADLIDYSAVKGCLIIRPYGYAIWENMQRHFDKRFKETGHENIYMPMFIPESLLNKEKDHVEGFAPEVAWVTHGGSEKLEEKLCVRPTSETLFCDHYANIISSYRDLPKLYNQWCSVVRWEKTTRPFLRSREFLWQEGHTAHATAKEAQEETIRMLNVYAECVETELALPVLKGRKTQKERFAGAVDTYCIEAMMYNGIALQAGTSHYFGQNFSKPFDITYSDKENKLQYVYQTSWGVSTRLIGALIMTHSDDNGLVLPPNVAPTKVVIVPIGKDEKVFEEANKLKELLKKEDISVIVDLTEKSPGFKFAEHEMRGVPIRLEIGPRDLAKGEVTIFRRDTYEKKNVNIDATIEKIKDELVLIQNNLYERALKRREEMTHTATTLEEMNEIIENKSGFVKAMWCGDMDCEIQVKDGTGITSRCIPFEEEQVSDKCVCCGKPAKHMLYWGKQY